MRKPDYADLVRCAIELHRQVESSRERLLENPIMPICCDVRQKINTKRNPDGKRLQKPIMPISCDVQQK